MAGLLPPGTAGAGSALMEEQETDGYHCARIVLQNLDDLPALSNFARNTMCNGAGRHGDCRHYHWPFLPDR